MPSLNMFSAPVLFVFFCSALFSCFWLQEHIIYEQQKFIKKKFIYFAVLTMNITEPN